MKIIKKICGIFCALMAITGICLAFTTTPAMPFIVEFIIFGVLSFLLLCKVSMFGRKKTKPIRVVHYEGIDGIPTDYPCTIELDDVTLKIKIRKKPENTITLSRERIISISVLGEDRFMQQFKGSNQVNKRELPMYYLVIQYDKGILVFWGTVKEHKNFIKLQNSILDTSSNIEL